MAYTTTSELEKKPGTNDIETGNGFYLRMHTFFYAEDIKRVLEQAENDPETKLSQLRVVNITL